MPLQSYSHLDRPMEGLAITKVHRLRQQLGMVDRILEPQTIAHFMEFVNRGKLPNGEDTALLRPTSEEVMLMNRPYHEWAPAPYNASTKPLIQLMMVRVGSQEDGDRLTLIGKNIHSVKNRLWEGMVPLSQTQWRERGLDRPENFNVACQHLSAVVAAFEYLNRPRVVSYLRETFNLIAGHLEDFEIALNTIRAQKGEEAVSMTGLWEEFIRALFEVMTSRAHDWVICHVNALREPLIRDLAAHRHPLEHTFSYSPEQWALTNKLHTLAEIATTADFGIWMPMHRYRGYVPPPVPAELGDLRSPDWDTRRKAYNDRIKTLSRINIVQSMFAGTRRSDPASGESLVQTCRFQIEAQNQARVEARGEKKILPPQSWMSGLLWHAELNQKKAGWGAGFAVYRLTYKQSHAEWMDFTKKVEAHMARWGDGITGADKVKPLLKLHWLDGRELGIADGDIETAKKHFQSIRHTNAFNGHRIHTEHLLVIDEPSVASYTTSSYASAFGAFPGIFEGFVLAVEATFDPAEPDQRLEESPGYAGQMRIQGNLVWSDLYATLEAQSAWVQDLWPLAMEHPNQVYVGLTVPLEINLWRKYRTVRGVAVYTFWKYLKEKRFL